VVCRHLDDLDAVVESDPNQWTPHRSRALQFVNRGLAELAIRKCGPVIAKVVEFEQPVSKVTES